jgi:ribosomal protein L37AE/L43A
MSGAHFDEKRVISALKKVVAELRYLPPVAQSRTLGSAATVLGIDQIATADDSPRYFAALRENERLTRERCEFRQMCTERDAEIARLRTENEMLLVERKADEDTIEDMIARTKDCERCGNYGYVSRGRDEIGCPECNPECVKLPEPAKVEGCDADGLPANPGCICAPITGDAPDPECPVHGATPFPPHPEYVRGYEIGWKSAQERYSADTHAEPAKADTFTAHPCESCGKEADRLTGDDYWICGPCAQELAESEQAEMPDMTAVLRRTPGTTEHLSAEIAAVLNRANAENGSNTPDFILSDFLLAVLFAWNEASTRREVWYGYDMQAGRVGSPVRKLGSAPEPAKEDCDPVTAMPEAATVTVRREPGDSTNKGSERERRKSEMAAGSQSMLRFVESVAGFPCEETDGMKCDERASGYRCRPCGARYLLAATTPEPPTTDAAPEQPAPVAMPAEKACCLTESECADIRAERDAEKARANGLERERDEARQSADTFLSTCEAVTAKAREYQARAEAAEARLAAMEAREPVGTLFPSPHGWCIGVNPKLREGQAVYASPPAAEAGEKAWDATWTLERGDYEDGDESFDVIALKASDGTIIVEEPVGVTEEPGPFAALLGSASSVKLGVRVLRDGDDSQ